MTRDEAIKWLERIEERYIHGGDEAFDEERKEALHMAIEALERKKGRWTKKAEYSDTPTVCTLCGHEYVEYVEGWEWEETGDLPNYCPNCGADMRCEDDE